MLVALVFLISRITIATAEIIIGFVAPITGPNAAVGAQIQRGAKMAAKDINDTGGIKGKKISFDIFDEASDPKQAVSDANKLAGDGVQFVVAHYSSGEAMNLLQQLVMQLMVSSILSRLIPARYQTIQHWSANSVPVDLNRKPILFILMPLCNFSRRQSRMLAKTRKLPPYI